MQIERSGLGIRARCTAKHCGPFLERLIPATAAQDSWNAYLASHKTVHVRSISIHYSAVASPAVARAVIERALATAGLPTAARGHP